jgi:hypothetical protein
MNPAPNYRACKLGDGRIDPTVAVSAIFIRDFLVEKLVDVERVWSPARNRLAQAMAAKRRRLESGHWNWRNKLENRLFAVECEGNVQGLMALATDPRTAALPPDGSVVYVDYVESAPWNLRLPLQKPQFLGVGTVLIGEAVRVSQELGFGGRVGLHSLPQAEGFYSKHCRMSPCGRDPNYSGLMYFEYADNEALRWLTDMGLDT